MPTTTFVDPPLARIGLSETQARAQGLDVIVVSTPVRELPTLPRPKIVANPRGLIKVIVDSITKQILGPTLLCVDSQEVINTVALAMRYGISAPELAANIFTHPSTPAGHRGVDGPEAVGAVQRDLERRLNAVRQENLRSSG